MIDEHTKNKKDFTRELRAIANLEIWFQGFIDTYLIMSGIDIKNLKKNYKIAITLFCDYLLIIVLSLPISYLISRGMVNANIYDFIVTITISSTASLLLLLLIDL